MNSNTAFRLIECPRDAMQGWVHQIPTAQKIAYINALLRVGFDTIDFGSFVSPKAIPQMADTAAVIGALDLSDTQSRLLAIVANTRGAEDALRHGAIDFLGFPFSVSETFQQRNTHASIAASLERVDEIQELCIRNNKELVVYMSMGFGNPYGDPYDESILLHWVAQMVAMDIRIISLADTVGLATPAQVQAALTTLIPAYPGVEFGVHLHAAPHQWREKIDAAMDAGCRRFDGALKGIGGCPMADDVLVGNMDTEQLIPYFRERGFLPSLNMDALADCSRMAMTVFA